MYQGPGFHKFVKLNGLLSKAPCMPATHPGGQNNDRCIIILLSGCTSCRESPSTCQQWYSLSPLHAPSSTGCKLQTQLHQFVLCNKSKTNGHLRNKTEYKYALHCGIVLLVINIKILKICKNHHYIICVDICKPVYKYYC